MGTDVGVLSVSIVSEVLLMLSVTIVSLGMGTDVGFTILSLGMGADVGVLMVGLLLSL